MQGIEKHLCGVWRSLKIFHYSGKVEPHTTAKYLELVFDEQGFQIVQAYQHRKKAPAEKWTIEEVRRHRYLVAGKKRRYELITVEADNLVLVDILKGEKIFFVRLPEWYQTIDPVITHVRHISPGEELEER